MKQMASQKIMKYIHFINKETSYDKKMIKNFGGTYLSDRITFSSCNIPLVPSFFFDPHFYDEIDSLDINNILEFAIDSLNKAILKKNSHKILFLMNLHASYDIALSNIPIIYNIGMSPKNIKHFIPHFKSEQLTWFIYAQYLSFVARYVLDINEPEILELSKSIDKMKSLSNWQETALSIARLLGDRFSDDPVSQLAIILKAWIRKYCHNNENLTLPGFIVEPQFISTTSKQQLEEVYLSTYSASKKDSIYGRIYTNIINLSSISMEEERFLAKIQGTSFQLHPLTETNQQKESNLNKFNKVLLNEIRDTADLLQSYFKAVVKMKIIIIRDYFYLTDFHLAQDISTSVYVKNLYKLYKEEEISSKEFVTKLTNEQLNNLLHPLIDKKNTDNIKFIQGGIVGAIGAAVGKVYFSTDSLINAYNHSRLHSSDDTFILCVGSSNAEDVKAIELAQGVLSIEGGYADHASVVARSVGKVSMINLDIKINKNSNIPQFTLNNMTVKEGDYITLEVNGNTSPIIHFGKLKLIKADIEKNGILDALNVIQSFVHSDFYVRANVDQPNEANIAKKLGAKGIGLCRTEHMFFRGDSIQMLRRLILSDKSKVNLTEVYDELEKIQSNDFYEMLKIMSPDPVTIRLLDAPLHEFLPADKNSIQQYVNYIKKQGSPENLEEISSVIERLKETNPMLGHRGCRLGVSFPEIYHLQEKAIFLAMYRLQKEKIETSVEIMVPLVFSPEELAFIRYGKQIEGKSIHGIQQVADHLAFNEHEGQAISYKVGVMLELSSAALQADRIACFADFFSFGTNDLTQTALGISRDDVGSFFPIYSEYDLLNGDPFTNLYPAVQELIQMAVNKIKLVRPEASIGLCGEHGFQAANIEFCIDSGLDYVSCTTYGVPLALLAIAQKNIRESK